MFDQDRWRMVEEQLHSRGIRNSSILVAMKDIPRHFFVPKELLDEAYEDHPLSIGFNQTISQPYIVALMLELSEPSLQKKLLEIGSGSGYLLAIASKLFKSAVGVERIEDLCDQSKISLKKAHIKNVRVVCKDGYEGLQEKGPYDAIIVSCSCSHVPNALIDQLAPGGILIAPVGDIFFQELHLIRKDAGGKLTTYSHCPVRFVPLISSHMNEQ